MAATIKQSELCDIIHIPASMAIPALAAAGVGHLRLPDDLFYNNKLRRGAATEIGRAIGKILSQNRFNNEEIRRAKNELMKARKDSVAVPVVYDKDDNGSIGRILNSGNGRAVLHLHLLNSTRKSAGDTLGSSGSWFDFALPLGGALPALPVLRILWRVVLYMLALVGVAALTGIVVGAPAPGVSASAASPGAIPTTPPSWTGYATAPVLQPPPTIQPRITAEPMLPVKSLEVVMGKTAGPNKRLYVFSDPLCPYCKRLEPQLAAMAARGYEVHIFPTPVHDEAKPLIAGIACADNKANAWRDAITNEHATTDGECREGKIAADESLRFFRQFGFNSTPTVINDTGTVHVGGFDSDDRLAAFIEGK